MLPHQSEVLKDKADETKTRARRYKHIARYQRDAQKMWALQTFDMLWWEEGDVSCARANVLAYLCVDVSLGWMSCVYKSSVNYYCKFTYIF